MSRPLFIGHYALCFGVHALFPRVPLSWLSATPLFLDVTPLYLDYEILDASLLALGFVVCAIWAALVAGSHFAVKRQQRTAVILALVVGMHECLDIAVQMPHWVCFSDTGNEHHLFGIGVVVEMIVFVLALLLYIMVTRARESTGRYVLWGYVGLLLSAHVLTLVVGNTTMETVLVGVVAVVLAVFVEEYREFQRDRPVAAVWS
eukprot:TRINITY_DN11995_c0_g2_i1.p1 TRINITY_DN11995_c0_g2~~TRINITY_DN11995_c0_g2_i1.p1  ORF type:complete len:211 (+),score=35.04 TRINITY_DN11995_c0_g2_i1:24-635(+)